MAAVTMSPDEAEIREDLRTFGKAWWLFLVAGVLWTWIGFAILSFDVTSVAMISALVGIVFIFASVEELVHAITMSGWRWVHAILSVVFLAGGAFAFAYPAQTFGTLAILIGWFLLFKGTLTVCLAIAGHGMPLWWLLLIAGILEIAIAVWAIGYPGRSAWLLVLWVGISAVFRGIGDIVTAFQVRKLKKEMA